MAWGSKLWVGLLAYVVAADAHAALTGRETLSTAWWRAVQHPRRRWPVTLIWAYLTGHLFHLVPERFDPLRRLEG
jgi:hypothetical protein